ncbi:MAG: hypothetical protein Ct9H300mP1_03700 [Planctomycetaceae bacterium]|nr:MAG: hypothetical protein Ct9H300mP1_03700 [Planctomycetaceae bacterium]
MPPMARLPIDRKLRRDTPSQNREPGPRIFSMMDCSEIRASAGWPKHHEYYRKNPGCDNTNGSG